MRETDRTVRLAGTGGAKWAVHFRARELAAEGRDVIELTIGEPDIDAPPQVVDAAIDSLRAGRTGYSDARGEHNLRAALAARYTERAGREIRPNHVLCLPGTQTALFVALMGVAQGGDEVLVGDPMYATYEGVVRAAGATIVPVPLRPERGFRLDPADLEAALTDRTSAILLTNPHNPTGAVLRADELEAVCRFAVEHDLWLVADEVYADFVPDSASFRSALSVEAAAENVLVLSSISKSHASPGFRSGWCIGPESFQERILPFVEAMLFGNQPFIADATEVAIREGSTVVSGMIERFGARAARLAERLHEATPLHVHVPDAGMFAMIDVSSSGLTGEAYALDLLENGGVAVMPGSSFGSTAESWVRVALTVDDDEIDRAIDRIIAHA